VSQFASPVTGPAGVLHQQGVPLGANSGVMQETVGVTHLFTPPPFFTCEDSFDGDSWLSSSLL
jgi:hypothetical protein